MKKLKVLSYLVYIYKLDTSRNRSLGGTGLGLSVVKAIMSQHHTNCGVENKEGGVEFWFGLEKE